jgi:DNA polymerase-3 subunit delta
MIRFLFGENDYALSRATTRVRDAFGEQHGDQSVSMHEGDQIELRDLPQFLQGQNLFADTKLTIIRGASSNKPLWEGLSDFLEGAGDIDVLFVEGKPDKRTRTFKWLQKHAEVRECKLLDERETITWLETESRRLGIECNHEIARFLVHHSGTDQWQLSNDLMKLSLANKPLSTDLIRELIEPNPSASVFDLLDAILSGRQADAQKMLDIVRTYEDPYRFMGLMISQLYALSLCVVADHRPSQQIAKDAGIHPYVAQKTQVLAKRIDRTRLQEIIDRVEECDLALKSTGADPWTLIIATVGRL